MLLCLQVNTEIVAIQRVITSAGEAQLKGLIQQQAAKTGSKKAAALLADWANAKAKFWQIVPPGEAGLLLGFSRVLILKESSLLPVQLVVIR
jgi:glutamate synthase domain-containing protein 3